MSTKNEPKPADKPEAKNPEEKPEDKAPEVVRDPLILTVSEHRALSPSDRETFRLSGGTVTNDPTK